MSILTQYSLSNMSWNTLLQDILMDQTVLWEVLKQLRPQEHKYGKILHIKTLSGGLTNMVYSVETQWWKYVLKIWEWLVREQEFFAVANNIPLVPKMLEFFTFGNQQAILMEYKSGINGKNAFDKIQDWKYIWKQMWSALRQLHANIHTKTHEAQDEVIGSVLEYLSWGNKKSDMEKLEKILWDKNMDIVSLHGDFSPHNCLFNQDETWKYEVSAVFDPSGRITKWPAMFDIFYVLNNRWVKDKESFKKWFLEWYGEIDFKSEEYQMLTKVFTVYLETLYVHLESEAV